MIFRVFFLALAACAILGTTYVGYRGYGSESRDLDRSIRAVGVGRGLSGSVK